MHLWQDIAQFIQAESSVSLEKLKAGLKGIHSSLFAEKGYVEVRHLLYSSFLKAARIQVASYTSAVLLHRMQVLIL